MQLFQLSSGKSMLLHIWVVRLCAFHNLVVTRSICFLKLYTICNKSFDFLFSISFHKYLQKLKVCAFSLFCLYTISLDNAVCISSYLLSIVNLHLIQKKFFLPKILPFIHAHSHFCFQQLIETSGNSKFSCFFGYHPKISQNSFTLSSLIINSS